MQSFKELPDFRQYMDRMGRLYEKMEAAYNYRAGEYGFSCDNCPDNCCRTRFYNHTWLEYCYLVDGLDTLPSDRRRKVEDRAEIVCRLVAAADRAGETPREMCPLNIDGRCIMYKHRLMICRLHGIPYEFAPPGKDRVYGEGCAVFTSRHGDQPYIPFDRTPFYSELSALERDFRQTAGIYEKFKMTIAEMILMAPRKPAAKFA